MFSGVLGSLLGEHRGILITVVAVLVILVGVLQVGGVPIPVLARRESTDADRTSGVSVFLLGCVYAVVGVCTGPILGSVLLIASVGGAVIRSGAPGDLRRGHGVAPACSRCCGAGSGAG